MGQREALLNVNSLDRRTKEWSQDDETKKQRERGLGPAKDKDIPCNTLLRDLS